MNLVSSEVFFKAVAEQTGRALDTARKLCRSRWEPVKVSVEAGHVKHYFSQKQFEQALEYFKETPPIGRGNHTNHRKKESAK